MEYYFNSNGYIGYIDGDGNISGDIDPESDTLISAEDYRRIKTVQDNSLSKAINGIGPLDYLPEMVTELNASDITSSIRDDIINLIMDKITEMQGD